MLKRFRSNGALFAFKKDMLKGKWWPTGGFICVIILLVSCKKGEISKPFVQNAFNSTNGFTISGDSFSGRQLLMNSADSNVGYYDTTLKRTNLVASGDTDSLSFSLQVHFSGNSAYGSARLIDSSDTVTIAILDNHSGRVFHYLSIASKTSFNVTQYEKVSGRILGAFSGKFINPAIAGDTVQVSNGRFSVTRLSDR